eukprot:GEMP01048208.1.p1 GENE.GEMP01048208.1~~GEMP01048208.1.p1  ORF type:complete len:295 (+),score=68.30 GEMP01048208.1:129-1013(+)
MDPHLVKLSKIMVQLLRYSDSSIADWISDDGFTEVSNLLASIRLKIEPPDQLPRPVERGDILTVAALSKKGENGKLRFELWQNDSEAYIRAVERRSASTSRPRQDRQRCSYDQLSKAMARILRYKHSAPNEDFVDDNYLSLDRLVTALRGHYPGPHPVPAEDILRVVGTSIRRGMPRFELWQEDGECFIHATPNHTESSAKAEAVTDAVTDATTLAQEPTYGTFEVLHKFRGATYKNELEEEFRNEDYLSLEKGMIITQLRPPEDEWCFGRIESGPEGDAPKEGWYPPTFVKAL